MLAVACGVAGGIAYWRTSTPPTSALSKDDFEEAAQPSDPLPPEVAGIEKEALAHGLAVALPSRDTPIDRLWSTLQGPAQAGNAAAACRLAIETIRCRSALRLAETLPPSPPSAHLSELQALRNFERNPQSFLRNEGENDPQLQMALDDFARGAQVSAERCEGTTQERLATARSLLRVAALAGQPDAQAVYAAGEAWFLTEAGGMGSAEFDQWRREAPLVVARMLDAGHPEAAGLLAGAYSGQTWLSGLYDYDLERASAFLILNTRLMGKPEMADQQLRDLPASVRASARVQAEELYDRHYAGRSTAKATYWLGAGIRDLYARNDDAPAPCAPTPPSS
jgi:hypothetical protein